jgi:uncharacterized protein YjbI with pentapeptide repeats
MADDDSKLAAPSADLDALSKSIDTASSVNTGLWLSYVLVLFYLAVAAGAVTHEDLLLENTVKLPFLNVELPLIAFFFVAPLLFLVVHAYTIVHFVFLAKKVGRFNDCLLARFPVGGSQISLIPNEQRLLLPSNIFVQLVAGPTEIRSGGFGRLLKTITWTTLIFGPISLFLLLQIQFLPYHSSFITWTHRVTLIIDLLLLWWLWPKMFGRRDDTRIWRRVKRSWGKLSLVGAASVATMLFSCTVATFPSEWEEWPLKWFTLAEPFRLNAMIFNGDVDPITRRRTSWFSNTLVLPGSDLSSSRKGDVKEYAIHLRGRRLEGAILSGANFGGQADLTGAHLEGSVLDAARLPGASFDDASLEGASLEGAWLQGASFYGAHLAGASLYAGNLEGAFFNNAHLEGARLDEAHLQAASFSLAQLDYATLSGSELYGASFERARIDTVDLSLSYLWRSEWDEQETAARGLYAVGVDWEPRIVTFRPTQGGQVLVSQGFASWNDEAYASLKSEILSLPAGENRKLALQRIAELDCHDQSLTPCNQASPVPGVFARATVSSENAFTNALAEGMEHLVCGYPSHGPTRIQFQRHVSDADAIAILRGWLGHYAFGRVGQQKATVLVVRFQSPECRVAKFLTPADKARLNDFAR